MQFEIGPRKKLEKINSTNDLRRAIDTEKVFVYHFTITIFEQHMYEY